VARKIFVLRYNGTTVSGFQDITAQLFPTATGDTLNGLSSFGEDANGEIYITDVSSGKVFKIVPVSPNVETTSLTVSVNRHPLVRCTGVPFKAHQLQKTADLTQQGLGFSTIAMPVAAADGTFQYEDLTVDTATSPPAYYRVVYP
jgi:hypothetical protein